MPELPDIEVYVDAIGRRVIGSTLQKLHVSSPFLVRSVDPPLTAACERKVLTVQRIGKRIAIGLAADYWLVLHLMVAGRLHWRDESPLRTNKTISKKTTSRYLAVFEFSSGCLLLTEAGHKKRASLYLLSGDQQLAAHDPGGSEPLLIDLATFRQQLTLENRTLKRALTDPRRFSGIGNAYSDEILHAAGLSPIRLSQKLTDDEIAGLYAATQSVLRFWQQKLQCEAGGTFPENVTAFRPDMAVHGKFGQPCPACGRPVQRIRYQNNETNYCAKCQTGGKLIADRSLSRLLKDSWPTEQE